MAEYEETTPEQKMAISNFFLMSSPPAQVNEVLEDVQKLVEDPNILSDQIVSGMLREHNLDRLVAAPLPGGDAGKKIIVSPFNAVDNDTYLDPDTGKAWKFNHLTSKFESSTELKQDLDAGVAAIRKATADAVNKACGASFNAGKYTICTFGTNQGELIIVVKGINAKLSSYWAGDWRSVFKVNVKASGAQEITGNIKLNVHYFEDGNVQLNTDFSPKGSIQVGSPEDTAKAIAKFISETQQDYQNNLEEMYVKMHGSTFKAMRRFLAINGQHFNWNTAAHAMADIAK